MTNSFICQDDDCVKIMPAKEEVDRHGHITLWPGHDLTGTPYCWKEGRGVRKHLEEA